VRKRAIQEGMSTLRRSGLHKVTEGLTTLEDVARETM
jgi:type IV pilus assembly protein PilB